MRCTITEAFYLHTHATDMDTLENCPICDRKISPAEKDNSRMYTVNCPRCTIFSISHMCMAAADMRAKIKDHSAALSGLSRELHSSDREAMKILTTNIDELAGDYLVPDTDDIERKAEKLLRELKLRSGTYGATILLQVDRDLSIAYAQDVHEFSGIVRLLADSGMISIETKTNLGYHVSLSARGWTKITSLLKNRPNNSTQAFVAIWFHDQMNASAKAICNAITTSGYIPMCIKDEHFSGRIMDKALGEIRSSKFLVVDLTGQRASVFFEAGFAHGIGLDIIYVYRDEPEVDSPLDFYVKHYQCYRYKDSSELEEIVTNVIKARIG